MRAYKIVTFSKTEQKIYKFLVYAQNQEEVIRLVTHPNTVIIKIRKALFSKHFFSQNTLLKFTEQLNILLQSGLHIEEALKIGMNSFQGSKVGFIMQILFLHLQRGNKFSDALQLHPLFPVFYVSMVKVGEKSSSLTSVIKELFLFLKDQKHMHGTLISALVYPLFLFVILCVGILLYIFFFFPRYQELLTSIDTDASVLVESNLQLLQTGILILFFSCVVGLIFRVLSKTVVSIKSSWDAILLRLPLVKTYILTQELYWVSFFLVSLLRSGMQISTAFLQLRYVIRNEYMKKVFHDIALQIQKGNSLEQELKKQSIIPHIFCQWVSIGTYTKDKTIVFDKLHDYYKQKLTSIWKLFEQWVQPLSIVVIGLIIFFVVQALIVPLFSVYINF